MDHLARTDAIEWDVEALVTAVSAGPLFAPVPTCPDFTVDDLAQHVGAFCAFWTHILCEGTGREKTPFEEVGSEGRSEWLAELGGHLVAELRDTPPETKVWTWYEPDQSAAFVARRCSHELAVHRVDAQLARGDAEPIDAELAADGIDEIFRIVERRAPDPVPTGFDGPRTLHLHGTDLDPAEWLIRLTPEGDLTVEHEHAKGDLALRGPVSDLEMLLYQRPTVGAVERFGDDAVLDAFHRRFTFD